jgi:hypothetical protein
MADIIQLRRDTAANWTSVDPVLAQGELGLEMDTDQFKIGDGVTAWSSLAYAATGLTGATGPEGPTGPTGAQGPAGADGADGADGTNEDSRIAGTDITNWNTAYGWGDHSTENYLVSTQDAVVGALTVNKSASAGLAGSLVSGSVVLDFANNQNFGLTLTGNITLANPTTETVGQTGFIAFEQDSTGGRTVSLGSEYLTAAGGGITLSAAASALDLVPYIVVASGEILLGAPQLAFA